MYIIILKILPWEYETIIYQITTNVENNSNYFITKEKSKIKKCKFRATEYEKKEVKSKQITFLYFYWIND